MNDNQLIYFDNRIELYWHAAIIGLAVLSGYLLFYILTRLMHRQAANPVKYIVMVSFPLAVILSRLQYCFFRQEEFSGIADILDLTDGGMGLYGAAAGVILSIVGVWLFNKTLSLPQMLDAASAAGCLAVAIGRFAAHFSKEELGFAVTNKYLQGLIFTAFSNTEKKDLVAVYAYESIAAAIIFIFLVVELILIYKLNRHCQGTAALSFAMLYCTSQAFLESWRSDSLFLNTLGFVRFSQVFSAVIFAVILIIMCVRYSMKFGFNAKQIYLWLALAALFAAALTCEFTMTGNTHLRNYGIMGICLLAIAVIGCCLIVKVQRIDGNSDNIQEPKPEI